MCEIYDESMDLIITSPPYFNIKDYSKDGYQNAKHSSQNSKDLGTFKDYENTLTLC